jgi:hypothetical protein
MNNQQRVAESLDLLNQIKMLNQPIVSPDYQVLVQSLYKSEYLSAGLIAESKEATAQAGRILANLIQQMANLYNDTDLQMLCMVLGEDSENLSGDNKLGQCFSLVDKMRRYGRLPELLELLTTQRPNGIWPQVSSIQPSVVSKPELAVVVATAGRVSPTVILQEVASYLDNLAKSLNVNFLFFQAAGQIPVSVDWNQFPRAFNLALNETNRLTGARRTHFFLAGPGPILFSFGCMWSTVKQGVVYHKGSDTYHPVITISHDLFNAE